MPVLFSKVKDGVKFGVWQISESLSQLEKMTSDTRLIEKSLSYRTEDRRCQFLASRILARELLASAYEFIENNVDGKPYLPSGKFCVSISHTNGYVAFAFSEDEVGIDIENSGNKAFRVRSKFLSEKEILDICSSEQAKDAMLRWSLKESVYKVYGRQCYDFKETIEIAPYDLSDEGYVSIKVLGSESVTAGYFIYDDFVLTICKR